jgi:hypothetical protein
MESGALRKLEHLSMSSVFVTPAQSSALTADRSINLRRERLFFSGMAIAMMIVAIIGFAPTYYLKAHFGTPALSPLLHWHGVAFTLWMVLLIAQTSLIAAGRVALHRQLGIAGVVLALAMMVLGGAVAITRAQQGLLGVPGVPPLVFLAIPLMTLIVFPVLFGVAIYFRSRSDIHKRLMLIGTVELITAAIARLPGVGIFGPPAFFGLANLFVIAIAIYDWRTRGRVHPATIWGGLFLLASQLGRLVISGTEAWHSFAVWLTS